MKLEPLIVIKNWKETFWNYWPQINNLRSLITWKNCLYKESISIALPIQGFLSSLKESHNHAVDLNVCEIGLFSDFFKQIEPQPYTARIYKLDRAEHV